MESSRPLAFNPLHHPLCLSHPLRLAATAWAPHVPFAMYLVAALRPRVIVELGTFTGVPYCAFCQAVRESGLESRCFAVGMWRGDEHSVPPSGLPVWALNWILRSWAEGLEGRVREEFLAMRVGDLIAEDPAGYLGRDFVTGLSAEKNFELACTTMLLGKKV